MLEIAFGWTNHETTRLINLVGGWKFNCVDFGNFLVVDYGGVLGPAPINTTELNFVGVWNFNCSDFGFFRGG